MSENCMSVFNGYEVKDRVARREIADLKASYVYVKTFDELRAALSNAENENKTIKVESHDVTATETLTITFPVTLVGNGKFTTQINFVNCDGFAVQCNNVQFRDMRIFSYAPDGGAFTGVHVHHPDGEKLTRFTLDNVDVAWFDTGVYLHTVWDVNLRNSEATFVTGTALHVEGKCVNSYVDNCAFVAKEGHTTGTGIQFGGDSGWNEGWMITNTLIYGFGTGIYASGMSHVHITNCIFDFCYKYAIILWDNSETVSGGWSVSNCYIATNGADTAIYDHTQMDHHAKGNRFIGNKIIDYVGGVRCFRMDENSTKNTIIGNQIRGYIYSLYSLTGDVIFTENRIEPFDDGHNGAVYANHCVFANNVGIQQPAICRQTIGSMSIYVDQTGTYDLTTLPNGSIAIRNAGLTGEKSEMYRVIGGALIPL